MYLVVFIQFIFLQFVVLATIVVAAQAGVLAPAGPLAYSAQILAPQHAPLAYAAPIAKVAAPLAVADEYDPHPQYNFAYDIQDGLTGDSKNHQEVRDGDVVQGSYSLIESDGFRRIVDYTADPVNGFNAVVRREPLVQKAVLAKAVAPIAPLAYAAPVAKIAAPLAYSAPIATKIYH